MSLLTVTLIDRPDFVADSETINKCGIISALSAPWKKENEPLCISIVVGQEKQETLGT